MTAKPLVSIVIPAYNVRGYIDSCLQSIFSQKYTNIETILVDDGSTDNIEEVIVKNKFTDKLRYIKQKNKGVSAARNRALEIATGDYVMFVDADDIIAPTFIETLLGNMQDADISTCSHTEFVDGDSPRFSAGMHTKRLDNEEFMAEVFYGDMISSAPHGKLFKKSVLDDLRFDTSISIGEDLDYLVRICRDKDLAIQHTDAKLYGYRSRQGSAMNSAYSQKHKEYHDLVQSIYDDTSKTQHRLVKAVSYRLFGVASFCLAISNSDEHNERYQQSIENTKVSVVLNNRSSIKNRVLAISYIISSRLTNYLRLRVWQR